MLLLILCSTSWGKVEPGNGTAFKDSKQKNKRTNDSADRPLRDDGDATNGRRRVTRGMVQPASIELEESSTFLATRHDIRDEEEVVMQWWPGDDGW